MFATEQKARCTRFAHDLGALALRSLHLFAGAGGGILADIILGHRPVCAVEINAYCRRVLVARQADRTLRPFPIWSDARTFDGRPWRGLVDIIAGGFPCQDLSLAGKGAGLDGARSGLWSEYARIVGEVRPGRVFIENVPALRGRGLDRVLRDLAGLGYAARWCVLGADAPAVGFRRRPIATHRRDRLWILGIRSDAHRDGQQQPSGADAEGGRRVAHLGRQTSSDADGSGCKQQRGRGANAAKLVALERCRWWSVKPGVGVLAYGVADRVEQLRALGNGQVPAVAALAWLLLNQ